MKLSLSLKDLMTAWAVPLALVLGQATGAHAAAITVPAGLNPGDNYRLVFVTSTTRNATSSNIADYNAFVTSAANLDLGLAALGTTWAALATTSTVGVLTNLLNEVGLASNDTIIRLYNTGGVLVATGVTVPMTGLYGGTFTSHSGFLNTTEAGGILPVVNVWTGTLGDGTTLATRELGSPQAAFVGATLLTFNNNWTTTSSQLVSSLFPLYGISGLLTVPSAVPEPSTLAMLGCASLALGLVKIRGVRK